MIHCTIHKLEKSRTISYYSTKKRTPVCILFLHYRGSPFACRVLCYLRQLPFGFRGGDLSGQLAWVRTYAGRGCFFSGLRLAALPFANCRSSCLNSSSPSSVIDSPDLRDGSGVPVKGTRPLPPLQVCPYLSTHIARPHSGR